MATKVEVKHSTGGQLIKKPSYLLELEDKWKRWTKIDDPEAFEAIKD